MGATASIVVIHQHKTLRSSPVVLYKERVGVYTSVAMTLHETCPLHGICSTYLGMEYESRRIGPVY